MRAPDIIADLHYRRLKEYILGHTGLAFYEDKDTDLALRIARRLEAKKAGSCAAYLQILRDGERGAEETDALVAELTIGETYFFRQSEHFAALRETVLPDLFERNRDRRMLRIWSAGCATGAEAYSVALLLELEYADRVSGWDISILGTDINRGFLERARAGRFDNWTLRASPEDLKARCFYQESKHWFLRPEFKRWTRFEYHNLVSDSMPVPFDAPGFDLIFCRNVMIYFDGALARATADRLHAGLAAGGWLLVGHAEHNTEFFRAFRTVMTAGAVVYQKPGGTETPAPRIPEPPPLVQAIPLPEVLPRLPPQAPPLPSPDLEEVRALADRGQWEAATAKCKRLLDSDRLNAAAHFTLGMILEHTGPQAAAEQHLRRALYLDRGFALAHFHLGLCLQRGGATARARRAFENALELLAVRPGQEQLEHGDGITVAELRDSVQLHIELLRKK